MSRVWLGLISAAFCLILAGCAGLAAGAGGEPQRESGGGKPARAAKPAQPTPEPTKPPIRIPELLGADGRLTVLILGSDLLKIAI